jgi:small-conductance mechanosensitive channel
VPTSARHDRRRPAAPATCPGRAPPAPGSAAPGRPQLLRAPAAPGGGPFRPARRPALRAAALALWLSAPAGARAAAPPGGPPDDAVRLKDERVLALRAARAGEPPAARARRASEALARALEDSPDATARVEVRGDTAAIHVGRVTVLELGPEDVAAEGAVGLEALANSHASRLDRALSAERRRARIASWVFDVSMVVFSGLLVFLLLGKLGDLDRRAAAWLRARPGHVPAARLHGVELVSGEALGRALAVGVRAGRWLLALAVAWGWIVFSLSLFGPTRGTGLLLGRVVVTPALSILSRIGGSLPVWVGAALAAALLWMLLRGVRLFFRSVARGETHVSWIPADVAEAAGAVVRVALVVLAAVFAAPVLTGTDQGTLAHVGTAALAAVALAAVPALANAAAGLPRLLGRTYRPGATAELGRARGVVRSVDLLHVELEAENGDRVLVPHLAALAAPVRLAAGPVPVRFELAVDPGAGLERVGEVVRRAGGSAELVRLDADAALFLVAGPDPGFAARVASALRAEGVALARTARPPGSA